MILDNRIRLRALVKAANAIAPGPWSIEEHGPGEALYSGRICDGLNSTHGLNLVLCVDPAFQWPAVRQFIAAADPTTVLALLDALNEAKIDALDNRLARERLQAVLDETCAVGRGHAHGPEPLPEFVGRLLQEKEALQEAALLAREALLKAGQFIDGQIIVRGYGPELLEPILAALAALEKVLPP